MAQVPAAPAAVGISRTRERVERLLLDEGPSTAAVLAGRLDLTQAGVRRHLDAMVEAGVLVANDPRPTPWRSRGRGRPAKVYALSESGHARARHSYDTLAAEALSFLAERGAIEEFAARRADQLRERYADVAGTRQLAEALSKDGYAATVHEGPHGTQLCQHHCPVANVATSFPQMCEAETAAIGELLGTHVQRLATIAHGDGVCTTHIPLETRAGHLDPNSSEPTGPERAREPRKGS